MSAIGLRVQLAISATEPPIVDFFPDRRVYCVARNYLDRIREMKEVGECDPPLFFQKPPDAVVLDGAQVPYPPFTLEE